MTNDMCSWIDGNKISYDIHIREIVSPVYRSTIRTLYNAISSIIVDFVRKVIQVNTTILTMICRMILMQQED